MQHKRKRTKMSFHERVPPHWQPEIGQPVELFASILSSPTCVANPRGPGADIFFDVQVCDDSEAISLH
jgi:hypothetical protein